MQPICTVKIEIHEYKTNAAMSYFSLSVCSGMVARASLDGVTVDDNLLILCYFTL